MSNYATTTELIGRFESDNDVLHAINNEAGAIGDATTLARLEDALEAAEADLHAYLGKLWDIPISVSGDDTLAAALKRWTLDLAKKHTYFRSDLVPEAAKERYDEIIKILQDIAMGKAVLPAESAPASTEARSPIAEWGDNDADSDGSERVFTRSRQSGL